MNQSFVKFSSDYKRILKQNIDSIPKEYFTKMVEYFLDAQRRGKHIFTAGNGSGAALAQHMAVDFNKGARGDNAKWRHFLFKVIPLTTDIASLTAWGNDISYKYIFSSQLENLYQEGDMLVCISASGNSPNIIEAARFVKKHKGIVLSLPCFNGTKIKKYADCFLQINDVHYGRIEDIHQITSHIISFYLKNHATNLKKKTT